jgi:hypothetical protein
MTTPLHKSKTFLEPFLTAVPPQTYSIPALSGISGRYVVIKPSLTNGDGYLTISQIQVIDFEGKNVALKKKVTASSRGGSPMDQKYGVAVLYNDVYNYLGGTSKDESAIVDGNTAPRFGLNNVFETSVENNNPRNGALPDNQYVEIDLSANYIIQNIIYTVRADSQNRRMYAPDGSYDTINQVDRLTNMRYEILDTNKTVVTSGIFSDNPNTHITTISFSESLFNVGAGSSALDTVSIPNIEYFKKYTAAYSNARDIIKNNVSLIRQVNSLYTAVNTVKTATTLNRTFDISGNIYYPIVKSAPIQFFKNIYKAASCPSNNLYCLPNASTNTLSSSSNIINSATAIGESLPMTIPIKIFGSATVAAKDELALSINLCNSVFLGAPDIVENYIRVSYDTNFDNIKPYIRAPDTDLNSTDSRWCMPDIVQVFTNGKYETQVAAVNVTWNTSTTAPDTKCIQERTMALLLAGGMGTGTSLIQAQAAAASQCPNITMGNCTTLLDPTKLALFPYAARVFMVQWIQNRMIRYKRFMNTNKFNELTAGGASRATELNNFKVGASPFIPEVAPIIQVPNYIDLRSPLLLDSIAQQFYEMLGGRYIMSFIYDVLPLGSTMLDIRFDLKVHADDINSFQPLADLKAQFENITRLSGSGVTINQDIYDQSNIDYQIEKSKGELNAIQNTLTTLKGAVARIFYTGASSGSGVSGVVTITGLIFDKKAVTSFISEMNCGMVVPIGEEDGNVNYVPKMDFTLNKPVNTITCNDPNTIRTMLDDYTQMVTQDKNILLKASPPLDTSKGDLFVNSVISSAQVSPSHCVLQWNEQLYDSVTNQPTTSSNITRYGLFTYVKDTENWYSPNYTFDASGFKLLAAPGSGPILPACQFDAAYYSRSAGDRFNALGSSATAIQTLKNDFIQNQFKNGKGPICPQTIPGYSFSDTAPYILADPSTASTLVANYKSQMATGGNPEVRGAVSLTALSAPITYTKPLPSHTNLANASGVCPTVTCDDMDILYSLVDQYNSDPSVPGTIIRVSHAYTPNPNQCDIKAQINYESEIQDIIPVTTIDPATNQPVKTFPMIKKGTVTYSYNASKELQGGSKALGSSMTGVQETTLALYVQLDKSNCSYNLADASGQNSGHSIQPNTPQLYKPLIYIKELGKRSINDAGSSIRNIQTNFAATEGSAKKTVTSYRADTYAALGAINKPLTTCPGIAAGCNDPFVQARIMLHYANQTPGVSITQILKTGSLDGRSCDVTFTTNTNETRGARFTMGLQGGVCTASGVVQSILPTPSYDNIKDMTTPLSTANTIGSTSGFTDYSPAFVNPNMGSKEYIIATEDAYPLKAHGFGLDRKRNSGPETAIHDKQFESPLKQEIPFVKMETETAPTYKYIRFRPLRTRDMNSEGVHIGKFTFYSGNEPVLFEGTVTNPMGTWEGNIKYVIGPGLRKGWYDAHKKSLVFAFKVPLIINGYSFHTAAPGKSTGNDPTAWKVEGSTTGTFWTTLNEQKKFPTPIERYKEIPIQAFYETPL